MMNRIELHASRILLVSGVTLVLAASVSSAANYTVNWLQMTPTPYGSAPPFVGNYNLPGVGNVQMSYTAHPDFAESRLQVAPMVTGSLTYGPDTYSWSNHEALARTNWGYSGVLNSSWTVTYTFPGTIPAGQLILGVQGLGRRNANAGENPPDCISVASVNQSGTHLGDWTGALNVGPTLFSGGVGSFAMQNTLTGPGGQDPWWNTGLALVRIDDAVNSLTVRFNQTSGDGVGVNLAVLVPEPATAGLLSLGGLLMRRRRRR